MSGEYEKQELIFQKRARKILQQQANLDRMTLETVLLMLTDLFADLYWSREE